MTDHEGTPPGQDPAPQDAPPPQQEPQELQISALTPEAVAQLFPKLEIGEAIAIGGMGAVYRARQPELDRQVALKILPPELCSEEEYVERFRTEARAMAQLNHPSLVGVYDFGQTSGYFANDYFYFMMEYVEGQNLHELISSHGKFGPEFGIPVLMHVCEGMAYAHQRGIVHLDLKPANIMLDNEGMVKILDFGLAKLLDPSTGSAVEDMGTPDYAAPERFQTGTPIDLRADIYSMGVILHEMLVGKPPREGEPSASQAVPGLAPEIDAIIARCMNPEPAQRYPDANEMKTDLGKVGAKVEEELIKSPRSVGLLAGGQAGPQVAAAAQGIQKRMKKRMRARRSRTAAIVLVLAALAAGGAWFAGLIPDSLLARLGLPSPPARSGEQLPPMFPELEKLYGTLQDQLELRVDAPRLDALDALSSKYGSALDRLVDTTQSSDGPPALVKEIAAERKRFTDERTAPAKLSGFPELARLQSVLREELGEIDDAARQARGTLLRQYDNALGNLLGEMKSAGRDQDAARVEQERERIRKIQ